MKKCPYCAEEIQDDAVKCRFCGEFLKRRPKWLTCLLGCLGTCLAMVLLSFFLVFLGVAVAKFMLAKMLASAASGPHANVEFLDQLGKMLAEFFNQFKDLFNANPAQQGTTF